MDHIEANTALLVIDVQRAVVAGSVDVPGVISRINDLLRRAREVESPIIFIQHEDADDPDLVNGSSGCQFAEGLDYRTSETAVAKKFHDSFADTTLGTLLNLNPPSSSRSW
jgi:nicotinamidase-related amidase